VRTTIVVLDSVGVGELPDAADFGDEGSHTLDNTLRATGTRLPNLASLGLGNLAGVHAIPPDPAPRAARARLAERSRGKDSTTGHWELMGIVLDAPFQTWPKGFPAPVMNAFGKATGRGWLANHPASGTEVIERYGERHLVTGDPIVYTSADSVFQVAAHTGIVPLETLYAWCLAAREILQGRYATARVIARPFTGEPGAFRRLEAERRDYSLPPPSPTVLDALAGAGREVIAIGKIADLYARRGITAEIHTRDNADGLRATEEAMSGSFDGLVFTNLVDFDARYGHRNDPAGYAAALAATDSYLPRLLACLRGDDLLVLTSDHGNDPTTPSTDHSREYAFALFAGPRIEPADLGTRDTFADLGATIADRHGVPWTGAGRSMWPQLRGER
jgi:phosphopentomutase